MANSTLKLITLDGWRNAVVQLAGVLDTADVTDTIALSAFTNNEQNKTLNAFRINKLRFAVDPNLGLSLFWNATTPILIVGLAGTGKLDYSKTGGLLPNQAATGFNGTINFATNGYSTRVTPGTKANYSLEIEMVKLYT